MDYRKNILEKKQILKNSCDRSGFDSLLGSRLVLFLKPWFSQRPSLVASVVFRNLFLAPITSEAPARAESFLNVLSCVRTLYLSFQTKQSCQGRPGPLSLPLSRLSLIASFLSFALFFFFFLTGLLENIINQNTRCSQGLRWFLGADLPKLDRVLERSMMACLLGLFRTERLASEMSAVTRVIDILRQEKKQQLYLMWIITDTSTDGSFREVIKLLLWELKLKSVQ